VKEREREKGRQREKEKEERERERERESTYDVGVSCLFAVCSFLSFCLRSLCSKFCVSVFCKVHVRVLNFYIFMFWVDFRFLLFFFGLVGCLCKFF
jgi:hypothetical protein